MQVQDSKKGIRNKDPSLFSPISTFDNRKKKGKKIPTVWKVMKLKNSREVDVMSWSILPRLLYSIYFWCYTQQLSGLFLLFLLVALAIFSSFSLLLYTGTIQACDLPWLLISHTVSMEVLLIFSVLCLMLHCSGVSFLVVVIARRNCLCGFNSDFPTC